MKTYRVKWEIDIDAESAPEAAAKALKIQRNSESAATVFEVALWRDSTQSWARSKTIDLMDGKYKSCKLLPGSYATWVDAKHAASEADTSSPSTYAWIVKDAEKKMGWRVVVSDDQDDAPDEFEAEFIFGVEQ
jgi:hypothetical protein